MKPPNIREASIADPATPSKGWQRNPAKTSKQLYVSATSPSLSSSALTDD
ncbi:hypothetical protein [Chitinophaga sp. 212800010-3]